MVAEWHPHQPWWFFPVGFPGFSERSLLGPPLLCFQLSAVLVVSFKYACAWTHVIRARIPLQDKQALPMRAMPHEESAKEDSPILKLHAGQAQHSVAGQVEATQACMCWKLCSQRLQCCLLSCVSLLICRSWSSGMTLSM